MIFAKGDEMTWSVVGTGRRGHRSSGAVFFVFPPPKGSDVALKLPFRMRVIGQKVTSGQNKGETGERLATRPSSS